MTQLSTIKPYKENERSIVFLEISCGNKKLGCVFFQLFDDICPHTCENFRALCEGNRGLTSTGVPLHYKGTKIFRIVQNFVIQGGDITNNDGSGGECIWTRKQGGRYNRYFPDENFEIGHSSCGLLSMANEGPNTNQSQFFITCAPCPWLDGRNVVFGKVIQGQDILSVVEGLGSLYGIVYSDVRISHCGYKKDRMVMDEKEEDMSIDSLIHHTEKQSISITQSPRAVSAVVFNTHEQNE